MNKARKSDGQRKDLSYVASLSQELGGDSPQSSIDEITAAASMASLASVIDINESAPDSSSVNDAINKLKNKVTTITDDDSDLLSFGESVLGLPDQQSTKTMSLGDLIRSLTKMFNSVPSDKRKTLSIRAEGYGSITGVRFDGDSIILEVQ